MSPALAVEDLAVDIGGREILRSICLAVPERRRVALCGPNGSGKSTLLRTLFGALPPTTGAVLIGGDLLGDLTRQQIARRVGVVLQERPIDFDFTVREGGNCQNEAVTERPGPDGALALRTVIPVRVTAGQDEPGMSERQIPQHRLLVIGNLTEPDPTIER